MVNGKGKNKPHKHKDKSWRPGDPPKGLSGTSVLCDRFVPMHLKGINHVPVYERWVICDDSSAGLGAEGSPSNMEPVITKMAENFIPRVPCLCGQTPEPVHGPGYYNPSRVHRVPPDLAFGLNNGQNAQKWRFSWADLDETNNIKEYSGVFRSALRSEHEELMRLYEKYSLYKWQLHRVDGPEKVPNAPGILPHDKYCRASIHIQGITDARPSLQVSDIVLLRPVQPIVGLMPDGWGGMHAGQYNIEIESRILAIVRGKGNMPDQVVVSWDLNPQQKEQLKDKAWVREYAIRFVPSSVVIDRCLTALDWLENLSPFQQAALKDILFPVAAPTVKALTPEQRKITYSHTMPQSPDYSADLDYAKPLNESQSSFVRMVRARTLDPSFEMTRPPCILTGPAGTGKTKTLIYAIADVLGLLPNSGQLMNQKNKNRVLVCCPSHAASDVLTRRLSKLLKRKEIFRMYDATRPSNTVPGHILPFTCQVPGSDRFTLPPPVVWTGLRVVVCTCMDAHLLYRSQITNYSIRAKQQCFRTFLLSEGSPLGLSFGQVKVSENPFFTHLFVDEAAQATEPEILCPISCVVDPHIGGRKAEIALIGDPRQLSPCVFSNNVSDSLGRSFMERLLRRPVSCVGGGEESLLGPNVQPDPNTGGLMDLIRYYANVDGQEQLTVFLTENFRGHPSFLMMPSSFFYFDRLRSAKAPDVEASAYWCSKLREVERLTSPVSVSILEQNDGSSPTNAFARIIRQTTWPIHFRGISGLDSSVSLKHFSGTDSWQNIKEANAVLEIISTLVKSGVDARRIGAMSPFRGQVVAIRKLLREQYLDAINVGTIENFQAVEQDVIVLSLTRATRSFVHNDVMKRSGVFKQPKKANVAMTRSENLFIVVGDPNVMWQDPCWRQWLRFCLRNGLWHGEGLLQWEGVPSVSLNGMSVASMIDLTKGEHEGMNSIVVSTLEKIHRCG